MRTSFATRIDKQRVADASLDADYFNNMQRLSKLSLLEERVKELEQEVKVMLSRGDCIKLSELMKDPGSKATLEELRDTKKKV